MKKIFLYIFAIGLISSFFVACGSSDDTYDTKSVLAWRQNNIDWLAQKQAMKNPDGTPYYTMVVPKWDPSSFVLIHYFNERTTNPDALKPLYTSTVDVRYRLSLYNGVVCDSSSLMTDYGPGIFRSQLTGLIDGWAAAVCDMNVGDTAEVIVPYALGYGQTSTGSIPPYSNLQFNIRLVDIYKYEISPEISTD